MRNIKKIKERIEDFLADYVATWSFILIYAFSSLIWLVVNYFDIFNFDPSLTILGFLFSWLSGIQASIVMISANRKEEKRQTLMEQDVKIGTKALGVAEKSYEIDIKNKEIIKNMSDRLAGMVSKINKLEEIISLMENEEQEKINEKRRNKRTR